MDLLSTQQLMGLTLGPQLITTGQYRNEVIEMQYWKKIDKDGNTATVESHSYIHLVPGAFLITKEEYDAFIASLPIIEPKPTRDPLAEIDELKARIIELETSSIIK